MAACGTASCSSCDGFGGILDASDNQGRYALNFADDEFNPAELHVLEEFMPRVRKGRFIVQPGSAESFGHLTMAHPELWSE